MHVKYITASLEEIREIKGALEDLAATGHRLAGIYAEMAAVAEAHVASLPEEILPLKEQKAFIG